MKTNVLLCLLAIIVFFASCKKNDSPNVPFGSQSTSAFIDGRIVPTITKTLSGMINYNYTLDRDTLYLIDGPLYVTNNKILTIESGTFIKGKHKSTTTSGFPSYLVITKGSQINAVGTPTAPIVFTSDRAKGLRAPGDWGGIVVLGESTTNKTNPQIEGIPVAQIPGGNTSLIQYGGSDPDNSSGAIQYVRIEYAGEFLVEGNELNGLTLGGVGSGTALDHVQVSYGRDDAFEFFGGTVNAKYLIAIGTDDDDYDFDFGYRGFIQFAVAVRDPLSTISGNPNGIEIDNDASGSTDAPLTRPTLANFTVLGYSPVKAATYNGIHWRRNASLRVYNSILAGYKRSGVEFDNTTPNGVTNNFALTSSDSSAFHNSLVHGYDANVIVSGTPTALPTIHYAGISTYLGTNPNSSIKLLNPFASIRTVTPVFNYWLNNPDPLIGTSPAHNSVFPYANIVVDSPSTFTFTSVNYKGAFGDQTTVASRWDGTGWASYQPNSNNY